ncbi:hypothetical protein [Nocardia sp. NPDC057272]|uniref:hypothetical protein n=1 Tax=Nocardia sp. NPDC057272 TaxID=3346079 RepID=UPI0036327EAE
MPIDYAIERREQAEPTDPTAIRWPEPSPLEPWWTEIMDGVSPLHLPRPDR